MTRRQRSILATSLVTQAFAVGLTHGIFPVFLEPIESAFDAPRTQIAVGQVAMTFALALGGLVTGRLFDGGHARRIMLSGATLLAVGLATAATARSLAQLVVAAIMMGASVPSIGPLSGATLVTRVFAGERGRALGWVGMGPPLGAGAFAAAAGYLVSRGDWRTSLGVLAVVALAVLWPVIWFVVPARFDEAAHAPGAAGVHATGASPLPTGSASPFRDPTYWGLAGMFALAAGISTAWTAHLLAFLGGQGLGVVERTGLLSTQFWLAAPASLLFGALGDRIAPQRLLLGILMGQGLILLVFSQSTASHPLPHAVMAGLSVAAGLIGGGLVPLFLLVLGGRVAGTAFGRALSVANLLMLPALAASAFVAAHGFERDGDYGGALLWLAAGHVVAIACLLGANRGRGSK